MRKGEATRQQIIKLSAPLFNQRGFAGASMQDIMQATGLEKGGIYRHFSGKQELAVEAFQYSLSQVVELRTPHESEQLASADRLRYMIRAFVERPSPIAGGCPIMNVAVDTDDTNPDLFKLAQGGLRFWKKRILAIVSEGIRQGEIRKQSDPERIANQIIATLEGALLISRLERKDDALSHAGEALLKMVDDIKR